MSELETTNEVKQKKEKDPQNIVIMAGLGITGIVVVISVLFLLNIFGIRNEIKETIVDSLLKERIDKITNEAEENYQSLLLVSMEEEKEALAAREAELLEKQKEVEEAIKKMDDLTVKTEEAYHKALQQEMDVFGTAEDVKELSGVYSNMEAAKAAGILTLIEDREMAAAILFGMKQDVTAQILTEMDASDAILLTQARYESGVVQPKEEGGD